MTLVATLLAHRKFNYGRFLVDVVRSGEFNLNSLLRSSGGYNYFRYRLHGLYDRDVGFCGDYHLRWYEGNRLYRRNSGILLDFGWFVYYIFGLDFGVRSIWFSG